ncbi:MAG: von Willebrand factor type A domain-containing protein [Chromatiaceae bacterium]
MKKPPLILPLPRPLYRSLNYAFTLMLALALTIAQLTACNPAPDPNATGANPPATQAGQPTTAEQPAAGDQATTAAQAIPVGQSSPTAHPAAARQTTAAGQPNTAAVKVATDEVAAADTRAKQPSGAPTPLQDRGSLADPSLLLKQAASGVVAATAIAPRAEWNPAVLPPPPLPLPPLTPEDRERYAKLTDNGVMLTREQPVSTFSIDVDTGSYANVRRFLNQGQLPPKDAVRTEELINYFDYAYPQPQDRGQPLALHTELAPTPWNANTLLLLVGLQGYVPAARPAANLVFLIDVSGSMDQPNKLPLLISAVKLLAGQLEARDRISLVTYAGNAGVVLEPTLGDQRAKILGALEQLRAGGSTHGSAGIQTAYRLAEQAHLPAGINRVILATDGDFNVGTVNHEALIQLIEQQRAKGISLTTLGFGGGNYNDHLMEQLADKGNGHYAYIDTLQKARKVLVDELASTLETIAGDVKVQIEFNPAQVAEYRLIGYENRLLAREDFNNDRVDAGDVGAGHRVTALYEITLAGRPTRIEPLRYGAVPIAAGETSATGGELAFLKLRYKLPGQAESTLISQAIATPTGQESASERLRFAAAVATFGQYLRGGASLNGFTLADIITLASKAKGEDASGYRTEFIGLIKLAQALQGA